MTDSIQAIEDQKQREAAWVQTGVERFKKHCAETDHVTGTAAGRAIMRAAHESLTARLDERRKEATERRDAMADTLLPALAMVGSTHLAAITVHVAIKMCWLFKASDRREMSKANILNSAMSLGEAVEHDVRFRAWAKEQREPAEKAALARLKEHMTDSPRTWRKRAIRLREIADDEWTDEQRILVGVELLAMLAEAAPETFEAPVVKFGSRTMRLLKLTDEATKALVTVSEVAAVAHPKIGLMLVKPRPWAYVEKAP